MTSANDVTNTPGQTYPQRVRGGNGRYVRSADTAERDAAAARLRTQGKTYDAIATALGFANKAAAREGVLRALAEIVTEPAKELRALELDRLDAALDVAIRIMSEQHLAHSGGKLIERVVDGQVVQVLDNGPVLAAIDRVVKIGESRRKLLGLDAPTRVDATVHEVTQQDLAVAELIRDAQAKQAIDRAAATGGAA